LPNIFEQDEAAIVLLVSTGIGLVGNVVFGYVADELRSGVKLLILALLIVAVGIFIMRN
jgi:predicted MFS family arabinose efflux permease